MTSLFRVSLGLGLVLALTAGVARARPAWLAGLGMDWGEVAELLVCLQYEDRRQEELNREGHTLLDRLVRRQRIAGKVIEGSLSLPEAARLFGQLNDLTPEFADAYREGYPGATRNECLCRQVIVWAGNELNHTPDRARALTRRLEAELESHLSRDGTVHLPGN
jgi:hypothetical protein